MKKDSTEKRIYMKNQVCCRIVALTLLLSLLFCLGGCGKSKQVVKKVSLQEPYLITFSGLSYENDPEKCSYIRYGVDETGDILLESRFYDTEGTLQTVGHLYIKNADGFYTYYTDEGEGYEKVEDGIASATVSNRHFEDLYLFQMRLNDATNIYEGHVSIEGGQTELFLGRECLLYTVKVEERDQSTDGKSLSRYDYTVDGETGACLRVVYRSFDESGQPLQGETGFVCTEFELSPGDFLVFLSKKP